jgi:Trk K+ transport system NAD-binding subunit
VAVIRSGELIIPSGDLQFEPADEVLAVVHSSQKKELAKFFDRVS